MKIRTVVRANAGMNYRYELILKRGELGSWQYSVSISLKSSDGLIATSAEREINGNESAARRFFDKLTENLVTPINLPYVIEDELVQS